MNLTVKQTIALDILEDDVTTELVYGGSAGGGKSYLGVYWILKSALKYPETRWLIGRSELKNLKLTTLNSLFDVCKLQGLKPVQHYNYNQQSGVIKLFNGSEIILKDLNHYPSDPNYDSLGSLEVTGIFADEISQISEKCWKILKSRIRYKLTEYGLIPKMLGTCNPAKNWVYVDFYKKSIDGTLEPYKRFIQALPTDNPNLPDTYVDTLNSLDNISRQRLLYGNWEFSVTDNDLLTYDQILDLFSNTHVLPDTSKKAITADIALQGSDKMVIVYWCGFVAMEIIVIPKTDAPEALASIENLANKHSVPKSRIVYDADGLGSFLIGFLKGAKPFHNGGKVLNDENYKNLKTQCIYKWCDRAREGGYYIKDEINKMEIIQEVEQLKRDKIDSDGKLEVLSKDKVKALINRSPDFSDSLIMREFLELKQPFFFV